jgi:hypothetical protein
MIVPVLEAMVEAGSSDTSYVGERVLEPASTIASSTETTAPVNTR